MSHPPHCLILWDVDGTLIDTDGMGRQAMIAAAANLFGDNLDWTHVEFAGCLDPAIFRQLLANNSHLPQKADHHDVFASLYLDELAHRLTHQPQRVRALAGIDHITSLLSQRNDVTQGLVTGNYTRAVPLKLASIDLNIDTFPISAFGDHAPTRPDLVRLAMDRFSDTCKTAILPKNVIVIGDTPHDVACAHAHGCHAFAVATGPFPLPALRDAGADSVVPDMTDPTPLLNLIDSLTE